MLLGQVEVDYLKCIPSDEQPNDNDVIVSLDVNAFYAPSLSPLSWTCFSSKGLEKAVVLLCCVALRCGAVRCGGLCCCVVLCCVVLCCVVLCCVVLCCVALLCLVTPATAFKQ